MSAKLETRNLHIPIEIRTEGEGASAKRTLVGYAAKYNARSEILVDPYSGSPFVELIAPGAFARSLRESPDVRALFNHNTDKVLGRVKAGTLRLEEDSIGLRFEVDLPNTSFANDLCESIARGDIDGCSFGFYCMDDTYAYIDGTNIRTLLDIQLIEISTGVAFPAYPDTVVALRSQFPAPPAPTPAGTPRLDAARRMLQFLDL